MNIAMEYMEQNNLPLAYDYFEKSLQKNTTDPFLHNEVAVYYYKKEMWVEFISVVVFYNPLNELLLVLGTKNVKSTYILH